MAGPAGSTVGAETLKERAAEIDASGAAIRPREAGEVEKRKEVTKVNVSDSGTCGNNHEGGNAEDNSPSDPALDRTTELLT